MSGRELPTPTKRSNRRCWTCKEVVDVADAVEIHTASGYGRAWECVSCNEKYGSNLGPCS